MNDDHQDSAPPESGSPDPDDSARRHDPGEGGPEAETRGGDGERDDGGEPEDGDELDEAALAETLSPAVRRLVKQFDLDVTGIRGSGPGGRVRAGDVMAVLGNRGAPLAAADEPLPPSSADVAAAAPQPGQDPGAPPPTSRPAAHASAPDLGAAPATSVFECDLGTIVEDRQQQREGGADVSLLSYFLIAAVEALRHVAEVNAAQSGVHLAVTRAANGRPATTIVRGAEGLSLEAMNAALAHDIADASESPGAPGTIPSGRAPSDPEGSSPTFSVHDHGASGSVLAIPTPLAGGCVASLGIGRPRRNVVLRQVDGQSVPRASAVCFVSLTYDPRQVTLDRANRFLAETVRVIERWPVT